MTNPLNPEALGPLYEALKAAEFCIYNAIDKPVTCPSCVGNVEYGGHEPGCKLAAALALAEQAPAEGGDDACSMAVKLRRYANCLPFADNNNAGVQETQEVMRSAAATLEIIDTTCGVYEKAAKLDKEHIATLQSALDAKDKELAEARGLLQEHVKTLYVCDLGGRFKVEDKTEAFLRDTGEGQVKAEQVQPFVDGKPWRCDCGGNVMTRRGDIYTCNACGDEYTGEGQKGGGS